VGGAVLTIEQRLNVLHVIDTTGPGGAETVFIQLASSLDKSRFSSFATVPGRGWVHDSLRKSGMDPIVIPTNRTFDVRYLAGLMRTVKRHKIGLIQSHLLSANVYSSLVGLRYRIPVISTFHGIVDVAAEDRFPRLKWRILNRGASDIVFVSEHLRRAYQATQPLRLDRTTSIPNGVDCSIFRPGNDVALREELKLQTDDILVGAVGNLRAPKAYDVFLRAAASLRRISSRYKFVIAGEGAGALREELMSLCDRLGIREAVHFAGFREHVEKVLQNLDLFLITSRSEGFSLATVQAMATGIPVVATRCGGPEEIVSDGVSGLLVDTDSPEQIVDAVERLMRDEALRQRLTRAARESAENQFSTNTMVARYEELYDRCSRSTPDSTADPSPDQLCGP
jgi:glycosyltransferase involved in cell wall biosynthesis